MDLLKFVFFSSLEYFSSFVFILIQFRFSLRDNIEKISLISILLSFVSYSFINADMQGISPLVQNAIFLIYIWIVLKVSLPSSLIMLLTGYTVFGMVQTCLAAIAYHLNLITGEFEMGATITYVVSICSSTIMFLLSMLVARLKGGFSFIEMRARISKRRMTPKQKFIVVYILIAFVVTLVANVYMLEKHHPPYLFLAAVLLAVIVGLFYITIKRDEMT